MNLDKFLQSHPDAKPTVICDRCMKSCYGYYTLSLKTKGLFVMCGDCGTHARPYMPSLPIPSVPSQDYLKHTMIQEDFLAQVDNAESVTEPALSNDAVS